MEVNYENWLWYDSYDSFVSFNVIFFSPTFGSALHRQRHRTSIGHPAPGTSRQCITPHRKSRQKVEQKLPEWLKTPFVSLPLASGWAGAPFRSVPFRGAGRSRYTAPENRRRPGSDPPDLVRPAQQHDAMTVLPRNTDKNGGTPPTAVLFGKEK